MIAAAVSATELGQALLGVLVILSYVASWHTRKKVTTDQKKAVQEIHVLVNSQMSVALARITELETQLQVKSVQVAKIDATGPA